MSDGLKVGFCGSGRFAALCLSLISERIIPQWVVTNVPRRSGRGMALHRTPVDDAAEKLHIKCLTTEKFSDDENTIAQIKNSCPDVILVIDFGHIVKEPVLSLPKFGCINIHPSKLPAYRGAAPIQHAIMDGLNETAVTIFKLDKGMDSGPVLAQVPVKIENTDDTGNLLEKCAHAGCEALLEYLCKTDIEKWIFTPQASTGLSLAPKIEKSEGQIDWKNSSEKISCLVRAIGETPGTFCFLRSRRLRILSVAEIEGSGTAGTVVGLHEKYPVVACGNGALKLICVQPEGKKNQNGDEWFRGSRLKVGDSIK